MTENEIGKELERTITSAMTVNLNIPETAQERIKSEVGSAITLAEPVTDEMKRRQSLPSSKLRALQDTTAAEIKHAEEELDKIKAFATVKMGDINDRAADRITKLQADCEHICHQIEQLNQRHAKLQGQIEDEEIRRDKAQMEAKEYYAGEIAIAQRIIDAKRALHQALQQG